MESGAKSKVSKLHFLNNVAVEGKTELDEFFHYFLESSIHQVKLKTKIMK